MNFKRKSRRRLFLLTRSRTPPISSEFRGGGGGGGFEHPKPPLSVRHWLVQLSMPLTCIWEDTGLAGTPIILTEVLFSPTRQILKECLKISHYYFFPNVFNFTRHNHSSIPMHFHQQLQLIHYC